MIQPSDAVLLGIVEGFTEFLPVSSTGHLILASRVLRLHGEALKAFEIIIQAGALGAVAGLYRASVAAMWRGLWGRDAAGRRLLVNLLVSFLPAALVGVALHEVITQRLFSVWPVVAALALGGVLMIAIDHWPGRQAAGRRPSRLEEITLNQALLIGCIQCAALWPGTSRAMVTIMGGMLLGLPATVAAEYSFLLALPTLGAATVFSAAHEGTALARDVGLVAILCGFASSAIVAAITVKAFIRYLTRRGLALFGWYRIGLAIAVWSIGLRT